MVELLGAVAAIDVHSEQLRGKYVTLLVDSEPVEGCLVKGYSSPRGRARSCVGLLGFSSEV